MGDVAVIPGWVVVPAQQVADCLRIAHVRWRQDATPWISGVAAAINWVTGGQDSPMSGLPVEPTRAEAKAEMSLADEATAADPDWARGVCAALEWLLGMHGRPPFTLPRRNPDGSVVTEEQLYVEELAKVWDGPEGRASARSKAAGTVARYRRLAAEADSVR